MTITKQVLKKEQNLLWNMVRNRFKPYAITAYIQKVFLQIRIQEFYRDALRFHKTKNQDIKQTDMLKLDFHLPIFLYLLQ